MHILKNFISIEDLEKRWSCSRDLIESFIRAGDDNASLTKWYAKEIRTRPDDGISAFVQHAQYLKGCIFDMTDVLSIEALNPELVQVLQEQEDGSPKMLNGKFIFSDKQLIKKNDLYQRWFGATNEEITSLFDDGKLRAYLYYKGPINGVVWCDEGRIYYHDRSDYLNIGSYEYNDDMCDYFLISDVESCESKYPEFIGNISAESLGIVQNDDLESKNSESEYIDANTLRKQMGMSPVEFVDYLRKNRDMPIFGRGIDDSSRRWFYKNASREVAAEMLEDISVHRIDIERHRQKMLCENVPAAYASEMPTLDDVMPTAPDDDAMPTVYDETCVFPDVESQLDNARKQIECLKQENEELQREIGDKNAKIAEVEHSLSQHTEREEPQGKADTKRWEASIGAACKAVVVMCRSGREDWVSGQNSASSIDQAGNETFNALLTRMYTGEGAVLSQAERAAWKALSDSGMKKGSGRPTTK